MIEGLTRREFLSYCGRLAALLALAPAAAPRVAEALESSVKVGPSILWSSFMTCQGCTAQLLQASNPGPAELILSALSIRYHETLMAATGSDALQAFTRTAAGTLHDDAFGFICVVEGSVATDPPEAVTIGGRSGLEILKNIALRADHVIAMGNCAAYGGLPAASPNRTGAVGVSDALSLGEAEPEAPVINIPTCPGNIDALLAIIAHIRMDGAAPELDELGRPLVLYADTVHEHCQRRGHYEAGEFVRRYGTRAEEDGYCLLPMGCKGPVTHAPCPKTGWNGHANTCIGAGACIGCAEPGFWDEFAPLSARLGDVPDAGLAPTSPEVIAGALGGAAALGLGAHFIGEAAQDRLPWSKKGAASGDQADETDDAPNDSANDVASADQAGGPA